MDASRDETLRSIEIEVIKHLFDPIFLQLVNQGDYPLKARDTILKNLIDTKIHYLLPLKVGRVECDFEGTVMSGFAPHTTLGNTLTMLALAKFIIPSDSYAYASGDDLVIHSHTSDASWIKQSIYDATLRTNCPIKKGFGLIIKDVTVTTNAFEFLSKDIYPEIKYIKRKPDRLSKTGDYSFSTVAKKIEGVMEIRHCNKIQLATTGGDNPALGGYLDNYNRLPSRGGLNDPELLRDDAFARRATSSATNYTDFLIDFTRDAMCYQFTPHPHYYENLANYSVGELLVCGLGAGINNQPISMKRRTPKNPDKGRIENKPAKNNDVESRQFKRQKEPVMLESQNRRETYVPKKNQNPNKAFITYRTMGTRNNKGLWNKRT